MKISFASKVITGLFLLLASTTTAQFQWAKKIGGGIYEKGKRLVTDNGGNVYTIGEFKGTVDFDPGSGVSNLTSVGFQNVFISKLDASGNFIWAKSFGGYSADGISKDINGNILLCGFFYGTVDFDPGTGVFNLISNGGTNFTNVYALKIDNDGNFKWAVSWGNNQTNVKDVSNDALGNTYLTGQYLGVIDFNPGAGVFNMGTSLITSGYILKIDATGIFGWAKEMKSVSLGASNSGIAIQIDGFGNIITTGSFGGNVDFNPGVGTDTLRSSGISDIYIQKLDSSGNFLWAVAVGSPTTNDLAWGLGIDATNNIYSVGNFGGTVDFDPGVGLANLTASGTGNAYIWKLDADGKFAWVKNIAEASAWAMTLDASGNVFTLGFVSATADFDPGPGTYSIAGISAFIQKLDATGKFVWARGYYLANALNDISVNGPDVYFTGTLAATIDFDPDSAVYNLTSSYPAIIISKLKSYATSYVFDKSKVETSYCVYPNPSQGLFTLDMQSDLSALNSTQVRILNILGETLYQTEVNDKLTTLNLDDQPSGIYFLYIQTTSGLSTKKIVKQ